MFDWLKKKHLKESPPDTQTHTASVEPTLHEQQALADRYEASIRLGALQRKSYGTITTGGQQLGMYSRLTRQANNKAMQDLIASDLARGMADAQHRAYVELMVLQVKEREEAEQVSQFLEQFYPMHLPDGWGFAPTSKEIFRLHAPSGAMYQVGFAFDKRLNRPMVTLDHVNADRNTEQDSFPDKETFVLHLLTLHSEKSNEAN